VNYEDNVPQEILTIQAAVWLHNFIMDTENLSYSALESPEMHFSISFDCIFFTAIYYIFFRELLLVDNYF
jgi:hypothetical protein